MKTRITELFGIKHPIMLAGMNWLTQPKIVAAVCNAGGLGNLAISGHTPEELRRDIREIRTLTNKPFAINQILISPTAKTNIAIVIEEKVPIVNYTLGRPPEIAPIIKAVHNYGGKIIATVALARHAIRAEQFGVDALSVTGHEAGGHPSRATSLVLIPIVASSVKVPLISAGGYFDGRGLAAALALGADAVSMGTRFIMTKECPIHEHWKQFILKATEQDTLYIYREELPSRVLRTKKAEAMMREGFPIISSLTGVLEIKRMLKLSWGELIRSGFRTRKASGDDEEGLGIFGQMREAAKAAKLYKIMYESDETIGAMYAGQDIGGISDIPTVAEVIERTVTEAKEILKKMKMQIGS